MLGLARIPHVWVTGNPGAHRGFAPDLDSYWCFYSCGACLNGRDGTTTRASDFVWAMSSALGRSLLATRRATTSGSRPSATCRCSTRSMAVSRSQSMNQVSSNSGSSSDHGGSPAQRLAGSFIRLQNWHGMINPSLNVIERECNCLASSPQAHIMHRVVQLTGVRQAGPEVQLRQSLTQQQVVAFHQQHPMPGSDPDVAGHRVAHAVRE